MLLGIKTAALAGKVASQAICRDRQEKLFMSLIRFRIRLLDEHGKGSPDTLLQVFYAIGADITITDADGWAEFEKECGPDQSCSARVVYQDDVLWNIEAKNGDTFSFSVIRGE